jgi:Putative DNA-binding domain
VNLAATQAALVNHLGARGEDKGQPADLAFVRGNRAIPPELAIEIYTNNVDGARVNALFAAYPVCVRILGEACFRAIARHHVTVDACTERDLNLYGGAFPGFLEQWVNRNDGFSDYLYLPDLAHLEWLLHSAYYADDDPGFDFNAFRHASATAPETLRLVPASSVRLVQSPYPLMAIRAANLGSGDASNVSADAVPEHLVVSRQDLHCRVERVSEITFRVLAACCTGTPLSEIAQSLGDRAQGLPAVVGQLIERAWVTGVAYDDRMEAL